MKFFFSVIAMNLKWKVLTKNLVSFTRWDSVTDQELPKKGERGWTVYRFKSGLSKK